MMPKIDGFEMVRRIRKTEVITPVLFLTGRSAINDVVKGFELGANDYLKKPFGMQELIVRIKALAKRASMYQTINHSIDLNKEITVSGNDSVFYVEDVIALGKNVRLWDEFTPNLV